MARVDNDQTFKFNEEELQESLIKVPFSRTLSFDDRQLKYRESRQFKKLTCTNPFRKNLVLQIEFLLNYGHMSKQIIYVSPFVSHLSFLAKLFPLHTFIVYNKSEDSRPRIRNVAYNNLNFNDNIAKSIYDQHKGHYLFICYNEMNTQKRWMSLLRPEIAMLRFKLPYDGTTISYLKGTIYYPVWGGVCSTETELVTNGTSTMEYSSVDYENIMYRFNNITRQETYLHDVRLRDVKGIDYCYDCYAEIHILQKYISLYKSDKTVDELMTTISNITKNKTLNWKHHGRVLFTNMPIQQKLNMI